MEIEKIYKGHERAFQKYRDLLFKWNEKINLTAITDPKEIEELHFMDSLSLVPAIQSRFPSKIVSRETLYSGGDPALHPEPPIGIGTCDIVRSVRSDGVNPIRPVLTRCEGITLLDIGSGAGLPGLAVKIACPEIEVTLVDSVKKKCDFIKTVARGLSLKGVTVIHHRMTEEDRLGDFDVIVSRAAFKMDKLIQLSRPNLKDSGIIIGMKGFEVTDEIEACAPLIKKYGLSPIEEKIYELPYSKQKRKLLICST